MIPYSLAFLYNSSMDNPVQVRSLSILDFGSDFHLDITQDFLWTVFTLFFMFYVFMTLIFAYHWHRYEVPGGLIFIGEVVYFTGSLLLIVTAGMAVSAF